MVGQDGEGQAVIGAETAPAETDLPPADSTVMEQTSPLERDLALSIGDGAAYGVMIGLGETYLSAFSLAIGLGEVYTGLLASLPILFGSLIQLISPWGVRQFQSHRRWVVFCAGMQAGCFIPLMMAAWLGRIDRATLMIVASIYWAASLGTGPAWNTWMGAIVPAPIRAAFFARRARLNQALVFVGFVGGGLALQLGRNWGPRETELMFVALFGMSFACRAVSTLLMSQQSEVPVDPKSLRDLSGRVIRTRLFTGDSGRLLILAVLMQAGVYFAGPYFAPFMLKTLAMPYGMYAVLLGVSFVVKFFCLPFWGRFAHRFGAQRMLWIGAIGIVPLAGGWLVSTNFYYLMALQALGGAAWGAYELAVLLLFFETIPARERTGILTWYNLANSLALAVGSMLGGGLLAGMGVTREAYLAVFVGSSLLRLIALIPFAWLPKTMVEADEVPIRPLGVRPAGGSLDSPILSAMPDQQPHKPSAAEGAPASRGTADDIVAEV